MTDQQIEDGYRRMNSALAPPVDVAVRVERRIRGRRSRRRAAVAGVAGFVVIGTVSGAVLLGGGDDQDGDTIATDNPPTAQGAFVLTRPDGSTQEFDELTLSCDETPAGDPAEAGYIYLFSPFDLDAAGEALTQPFVYLEARADKVDGETFTLPVDSASGSSDDLPFVLFVAEADGQGKKRPNEVSSTESGAAGTVVVERASCDPTPVLELEVDATLGSEVQQGTLDLTGSFG